MPEEAAFSYERQILLQNDFPRVTPLATDKADPDEKFFIRTHRAFEIWFAEVLDDLEYARRLLAKAEVPEDDVPKAAHHIHRAATIFDLLKNHLPVLETLHTSSFYDFRPFLFGASGGDSYRFRTIEWVLGFLEQDLLQYVRERQGYCADGAMEDSLVQYRKRDRHEPTILHNRLEEGEYWDRAASGHSLRSAVLAWLARTPFLGESGELASSHYDYFKKQYVPAYVDAYCNDTKVAHGLGLGDRNAKVEDVVAKARTEAGKRADWFLDDSRRAAIVFILQFAEQPLLAWPAMLLEALIELDEALANWRERHIQMVAHVLGGGRVSTMGASASGLPSLRSTTGKRAFPEIWDARSFFLSRNEAENVYPTRTKDGRYPAQLRKLRFAYEAEEKRD